MIGWARSTLRWAVLTIAVALAALSHAASGAAQEIPPGGYYADGAYYMPPAPAGPGSAQVTAPALSTCLLSYSVPNVYVASTANAVRIYSFWPGGGGAAPGFPYVPAYAPQTEC